jgi:DNA-binding transcriptional LysR family regulator
MTDPSKGEVRLSCSELIAAGVLPSTLDNFSSQYPDIKLHVLELGCGASEFTELQERRVDLRFALLSRPLDTQLEKEFDAEVLCHDRMCLAGGPTSPLARRRKIDLEELVDQPSIAPSPLVPGGAAIAEAFRSRGLPAPQFAITTFSVALRNCLGMSGRFVIALPRSVLDCYAHRFGLKLLPIDLPKAETSRHNDYPQES